MVEETVDLWIGREFGESILILDLTERVRRGGKEKQDKR